MEMHFQFNRRYAATMDRIPFQATAAGALYERIAWLPVAIVLDHVRSLYNVGAFFRTHSHAGNEAFPERGPGGRSGDLRTAPQVPQPVRRMGGLPWKLPQPLARLRLTLDFMPSPSPDHPGLFIRDPYRYSDAMLIVPPPLVECLQCFDGQRTELDLRAALVRITNDLEVGEIGRHLIETLSAAGFLEDETFEQMRRERRTPPIRKSCSGRLPLTWMALRRPLPTARCSPSPRRMSAPRAAGDPTARPMPT